MPWHPTRLDETSLPQGFFEGTSTTRRLPSRQREAADPLYPGYPFNLRLVAGLTPIVAGGPLDFKVDRPQGMKGFVINLTVQGRGQVFEGNRGFACEPLDLLLFPPLARHDYGRDPGCADWFHRWVYFQPRGFWTPWLRWPEATGGVGRIRLKHPALLEEFDSLFQQVESDHRGAGETAEDLAMNRLERLLIRCHEEFSGDTDRRQDPRVEAACRFVGGNLAKDLTVDEIAAAVALSASRLSELFREQVGMSVLRWREDQRMLLAKHLLESSNTSVAVISAMVGYEDQLYFSRVFRRCVGVSPTDFRRRA